MAIIIYYHLTLILDCDDLIKKTIDSQHTKINIICNIRTLQLFTKFDRIFRRGSLKMQAHTNHSF